MCAEQWHPEKNELRYGIDVERLRFALEAFQVPRSQWRLGWSWMAFIAATLNHPPAGDSDG